MDGSIVIGTEIDTKGFDSQIKYIESKMLNIEDKLKQADMGFEVGDTEKLEADYERLGNQLLGLKQKQEKYNQSLNQVSVNKLNSIEKQVKNIGNSMTNVTKKVVGWGLALLSVRGVYSFINNSISTLSQYNEKIGTDLEYIRFALASTLQPVIERLIQLVYKLLTYINYIAKAWFGVDLFANASAKTFNKNAKAIGKATKQAKELNKQLAGFDEMNVLQDNSNAGADAGGGVGGGAVPSMDLSSWQGEVPDWVKWIADNKDVVIAGLLGIAAALLALKMGLGPLKALGIGVAIAGIAYTIQALMDYLKDPSWKNFGKVIQGIGVAILGVGIAIGSVPAIVIGAIVLIVGTIIKYWEQIKGVLQGGIDWLTGKSDWVRNMFGDTVGDIYDIFVGVLQELLNWFDLTFKSLKGVFDGIITFVKGVFTGNWKQAWEGVKQVFGNIFNWIKGTARSVLTMLLSLAVSIGKAVGGVISGAFKAVVNGVLRAMENILNAPIRAVNSLIGVINRVPGVRLSRLSTFRLPRLAKGGIVNNPGPGVMMGSYVAGERGPEAVLPLNDETLDRLGEAIARHQNINATIPVYVGNRQIVREIRKIESDNAFAFNS